MSVGQARRGKSFGRLDGLGRRLFEGESGSVWVRTEEDFSTTIVLMPEEFFHA